MHFKEVAVVHAELTWSKGITKLPQKDQKRVDGRLKICLPFLSSFFSLDHDFIDPIFFLLGFTKPSFITDSIQIKFDTIKNTKWNAMNLNCFSYRRLSI
jgi:hypothetical protein